MNASNSSQLGSRDTAGGLLPLGPEGLSCARCLPGEHPYCSMGCLLIRGEHLAVFKAPSVNMLTCANAIEERGLGTYSA
jgi:hypothetical protein